jgi:pimeloyl-ACP methyl ester carboxylesterase
VGRAVAEDGRVTRPVAVLLPGAGSSADFVGRAFAAALADHEVVAVPPEPGPCVVDRAAAALDAAAAAYGDRLRLVGGVSLGAHVAARWAARRAPAPPSRRAGLVLALPAWTGRPGAVAAATGAAADRVDRLGIAGALAAARAAGVGWVADELAAAWPAYGERLGPTLRAAARSAGPSVAELRALDLPVGLVAFTDDPLHPLAVAEQWAKLLPRATLHRLRLADLATDRGRLGAAARTALDTTRLRPVGPPTPADSDSAPPTEAEP